MWTFKVNMKRRQKLVLTSREAKSSRSWATDRPTLPGGTGTIMIIVLVCFLLAVEGHMSIGDTFYFSQSPQSDKVVEGRPHTLHCNVSDTTNISFSWVKDGETVKRTHRRFMIGASLHMRRVSRFEDSGEYACIAHNMSSGFALTSLPAHLRVVYTKIVDLGFPTACYVEMTQERPLPIWRQTNLSYCVRIVPI
ncbi:tyrosine-protein kinase-like otk [Oratosquilla oratoria]|uniref:tyrosine-protein kinase-like otk n=1 Tax=Oratosquilla oratoria TaxID=337810 RepID=UPI003F77309B